MQKREQLSSVEEQEQNSENKNQLYSFEEIRELARKGALYNEERKYYWDDDYQCDMPYDQVDIKPEVVKRLDFSDQRLIQFLSKDKKLNKSTIANIIKNNQEIKVTEDFLETYFSSSYVSNIYRFFECCIDRLVYPVSAKKFLSDYWPFDSRKGMLMEMGKYINSGGNNIILDPKTAKELQGIVSDERLKECLQVNRSSFENIVHAKEIQEFIEKYPDLLIKIGGINWQFNRLLREDGLIWLEALSILADNHQEAYLDDLFGIGGLFTKENIHLFKPYMERYHGAIDTYLIERFLRRKGIEEKLMFEEDEREGFEHHRVLENSENLYLSIHENERNEDPLIIHDNERRRERVKNWDKPLYRSIGFGGLYMLWKNGELPLTHTRGHMNTDAEANALMTFWSDTPFRNFPESDEAVVSIEPEDWDNPPEIWKGRMRVELKDGWNEYDFYEGSFEEFYIQDVIKKEQLHSIKRFSHGFHRVAKTEVEEMREKKTVEEKRAWIEEQKFSTISSTIRKIMFTLYGDLFKDGDKALQEKREQEIFSEIIEFFDWVFSLELFDEENNDSVSMLSGRTYENSPSFKGGIAYSTKNMAD